MKIHIACALCVVVSLPMAPATAEPVDNCTSLLGSLSVELRVARSLPPTRRTSFVCPKDVDTLVGSSRQRILNSLGTPDASGNIGPQGQLTWSYFYSGVPQKQRGAGVPELRFSFGESQQVVEVQCATTP